MSAPDTDLATQQRKHRPSLVGIGLVVGFALVLLAGLLVWLAANGDTPEGADVQVQPGIGTIETD